MLILIVAGGPDKGRVHELRDDREVVLGRESADLSFNDAKMSRRHARLWCDGGRWYLEDLDSKHGTHRNRRPVEGRQPLKDGDYVQVGKTVLVVARVSTDPLDGTTPRPPSIAGRGRVGRRLTATHLIGVAAAAAVLALGLTAASLLHDQRQADRLDRRLAALGDETPTQRDLRRDVRLAMQAKRDHERRVETMIAAFGPRHDAMMPKLDAVLATLEAQPDVAGPLTALAQAVEDQGRRQTQDGLHEKIDTALAMLEEAGGEAEALAEQFRTAMDRRLDEAETFNPAALVEQLTELRQLIETRPAAADPAEALRPMVDEVLARLDTLPDADDATPQAEVLAAIADLRDALPADPSARLDAVLARLDAQPSAEQLAAVDRRLADLAAAWAQRDDTQLIRDDLARLAASQAGRADARAAAADDPLLGQVLQQVEALAQHDGKLDAILATIKQQPYDNRAMLQEVLAQAGDRADTLTEPQVAALLDQTMAELRGKSITDADQLRRLIQREVVAAVGRAHGERPRPDAAEDTRLTRTETAYKLAFESGKAVSIGVSRDPLTGRRVAGRTLDPAAAAAAGHETWRDWYLMDDLARRTDLQRQAEAVVHARRDRPRVLAMPKVDFEADVELDPDMNTTVSRPAE
ncbi:MAG: FHA domain-containing protein [Planctomycetota bacterium]